jgi:hypothetical protein
MALSMATMLPIDDQVVVGCLDIERFRGDSIFARAYRYGLKSVPPANRGALNGVTGHVAESVIEALLSDLGYAMLWHFTGPLSGGHGVDLIALASDNRIVAVEVKATLRPGRWPRPSRGELDQFTSDWLSKTDNPGMRNWDLTGDNVWGLIAVVNFAQRGCRFALTSNFRSAVPATTIDDLTDGTRWGAE